MHFSTVSKTVGCAVWVLALAAADAWGASHQWRFHELFSNSDGTIQFMEMKECCGSTAEWGLQGKWVLVVNAGNQ